MRRFTWFPILLLASLIIPLGGLSGQCNSGVFPGATPCGPFRTASVLLTITDTTGNILPASTINFSVNGGATTTLRCQNNCAEFPVGFNAVGQFDIAISSPGFVDETRTVDVASADICSPSTESLSVAMNLDDTVGALAGAWETKNIFGRSILRFGRHGEIIGAILFNRTIDGDGNFYVSYNNRPIRGAPGQPIQFFSASDPTRSGDTFTFLTVTFGFPMGFQDATMSADFGTLIGILQGLPPGVSAVYTRLADIPEPLQDP